MTIAAILVLLALISFALAALNANVGGISLRDAGFAFLCGAILAGLLG